MEIEYYAEQYNPDENYGKSISFIYQHLYKYINNNRQLKHEFYLEHRVQEEKEEIKQQDPDIWFSNEKKYVTFDDIVISSGLKKKEVWKKIKKEKMLAVFDEHDVKKVFGIDFPKG